MCEELEYNLSKKSVLFPKSIKDEHDKVQQLIKIKHDPVMDVKIREVYPGLHQSYYYEDDKYLIRPPKDFNEFIKEGTKLLHCVCSNGYYKEHVEGTRLIFFIRQKKKPNTPYYTVEYDSGERRIVQCYGYRHVSSTPQIKSFTGEWLKRYVGVMDERVAA
jgi:hypothetical protein